MCPRAQSQARGTRFTILRGWYGIFRFMESVESQGRAVCKAVSRQGIECRGCRLLKGAVSLALQVLRLVNVNC